MSTPTRHYPLGKDMRIRLSGADIGTSTLVPFSPTCYWDSKELGGGANTVYLCFAMS